MKTHKTLNLNYYRITKSICILVTKHTHYEKALIDTYTYTLNLFCSKS